MSGYRWVPMIVFLILLIHGASIGLTDDEAYYWVLGQTPAWGYGYHPPMVAWITALSDALLGWTAPSHPLRVRLASAALTSGILWVLRACLAPHG
jgi:4-amino-4-deoxy-L-arabinose transferase-like glycosyltransferase